MNYSGEPDVPLFEQIIQELLNALRDSDLFDSRRVDQIRLLGEARRLHRPDQVIEIVREAER